MTDALTDPAATAGEPDPDADGTAPTSGSTGDAALGAPAAPAGTTLLAEPPVEPELDVDEQAGDDPGAGLGGPDTPGVAADRRWLRPDGVVLQSWQKFIDMPVEGYITLFVVAACVIFVFVQLHPSQLFSPTTPAGGDMGAHVWGPAYLRDHLLTKGRLTGWTPDWYAGFPAYQFYMIIPSLAIAVLSWVIPYGVAFKLVAVSGCVSLPFTAYFFGRMTRLPFPAPALLSVGALLYLFDRSFSIYGGNIASTLAGEFAFSISLSFGIMYLAVLARGLETGKHRGWAALLLALCGLCHLIPFIFVIVCSVLWFVIRPGIGQVKYLVTMGAVGGALVSFWIIPFYGRSGYMTDMGWEKITAYRDYLWDRDKLDPQLVNVPDLKWVIAFAAVGLLLSLVYRRRAGVFLALTAATFALGFVYAPQARLWNARLLPFYYLALYLLAAVGIAELGRLLSALFARDVNRPIRWVAAATPIAGCACALIMLGMSLQVMPGGHVDSAGVYRWGPGGIISTTDRSFIDSWADWNFQGYEGWDTPVIKDAQGNPVVDANGNVEVGPPTYKKSYPEYYAVMETMKNIGSTQGCGRAMWEHEEQHDRYGTPMAMMLLPFWTDGCIGSMEGLYFEASGTTPYHFLNQDELSWGPSNAERDLPYGPGPPTKAEFDLGVAHLQMMGVKYYMAINDNTKNLANANSALSTIATSGPWTIYSVADAPLVEPLKNQPAVLTGQPTTGGPWQDTSVCWYQNQSDWDVTLTADGPSDWQRVTRTTQPAADATPAEKCESPTPWSWFSNTAPTATALPATNVTNIETSDDSISFDVSQTGVPVLVKASYFPNWKVSGADGPYRSTPNFMVVVPTANHVELHYGYTMLDLVAYFITLLGFVGLYFLFRAKPVEINPPWSFWGRAERPDLYPSAGADLRFGGDGFDDETARALASIIPDLSPGYGYGVGPPPAPPGSAPGTGLGGDPAAWGAAPPGYDPTAWAPPGTSGASEPLSGRPDEQSGDAPDTMSFMPPAVDPVEHVEPLEPLEPLDLLADPPAWRDDPLDGPADGTAAP
jgi:hypothetical protein